MQNCKREMEGKNEKRKEADIRAVLGGVSG